MLRLKGLRNLQASAFISEASVGVEMNCKFDVLCRWAGGHSSAPFVVVA